MKLRPEALPLLQALADVLIDHPLNEVRVQGHIHQGHIHNVPMQTAQFPSNWDLSTARVASAVLALSEIYEVPAEHLSASGFTEYKPLADNMTPESRAKKRRVELLVVMND